MECQETDECHNAKNACINRLNRMMRSPTSQTGETRLDKAQRDVEYHYTPEGKPCNEDLNMRQNRWRQRWRRGPNGS